MQRRTKPGRRHKRQEWNLYPTLIAHPHRCLLLQCCRCDIDNKVCHRNNSVQLLFCRITHSGLKAHRFRTFNVLVCPPSVTERFLSQPLVCGTVFHRTSLLPPLSPSSVVVIISSLLTFLCRFLTLLSFVQCRRSDLPFWTL